MGSIVARTVYESSCGGVVGREFCEFDVCIVGAKMTVSWGRWVLALVVVDSGRVGKIMPQKCHESREDEISFTINVLELLLTP